MVWSPCERIEGSCKSLGLIEGRRSFFVQSP
jgi:hypothetical protein